MFGFIKIAKRIVNVIPEQFKKPARWFFVLSIVLLVLDVFSIFLLIPIMISLLDQTANNPFLPLDFLNNNKYLLLVIVILFFLVKNYLAIRINKYQARVAYNLSTEYSLLLSKHYILGNYLDFKKQKKSSIIKEIIFVANDFVSNVILSVNTILSEITLLLFIFIIGLYFYFTITLIIVIISGLIIYSINYYNRSVIDKINKTRSQDYEENISNLTNLLNGYMSIKSPDLLNHFLDKFHKSNKNLNNNYAVLHAKKTNSSKQTEILMLLMLCGVFFIVHFFSFSELNTAMFLSIFGALFFKAIPAINKLNNGLTNLNAHKYSLDILEKKLDAIYKINSNISPLFFKSSIKLEQISFYYQKDEPVLSNINLEIKKGDFVAISGVSGVGKTTLLNIISKLIDPISGSILLDNVKITTTIKYHYFKLITYLTQKPFIYEGTILENLFLKNTKYNSSKLKEILISLDLFNTIDQLPNKLNTYIGNDGSNLSGGQLQRLCIARAILYQPEILILDEATNNLDKETESKVLAFLKTFAKETNTTIISVSHHLENEDETFNTIIHLD